MTASSPLASFTRVLIIGAILVAAMSLGASLVNPVLFGVVLAVVATPAIVWLEERGLQRWMAILAIVGIIVAISVIIIAISSLSLIQLGTAIPAYQELLQSQLSALQSWLAARGISISLPSSLPLAGNAFIPSLTTILTGLGTLFVDFLVIILALIFLLFDIAGVGQKLYTLAGSDQTAPDRIFHFGRSLVDYTVIRIKTGLATGVATAILLALLGVNAPGLWGLLVAILSFIPYFGLPLASLPPAGVAGLQYGLLGALAVLAGIAVIDLVVRTFVFPHQIDRITGLLGSVIVISVFFWTWVLGVPGLFLAVPLTMFVKAALGSTSETQWLAVLMEPAAPAGGSGQEEAPR
jgi:AI-2 transport protein TqsA